MDPRITELLIEIFFYLAFGAVMLIYSAYKKRERYWRIFAFFFPVFYSLLEFFGFLEKGDK